MLRYHGPVVTELGEAQLGSWGGGCSNTYSGASRGTPGDIECWDPFMAVHAALSIGTTTPPAEVSAALGPLGENLKEAWHFNPESQGLTSYSSQHRPHETNTLDALVTGRIYWIELGRNQVVTLNGVERSLVAGWIEKSWSEAGYIRYSLISRPQ